MKLPALLLLCLTLTDCTRGERMTRPVSQSSFVYQPPIWYGALGFTNPDSLPGAYQSRVIGFGVVRFETISVDTGDMTTQLIRFDDDDFYAQVRGMSGEEFEATRFGPWSNRTRVRTTRGENDRRDGVQ